MTGHIELLQPQSLRTRQHVGAVACTVVALCTLGLFASAGWNLWSTLRASQKLLNESVHIHDLAKEITHLGEVLTLSAHLAAATSDLRWEQRCRAIEPKLDDAIKEAIELALSSFEGESAAQTGAANNKLVEMENRAFDLLRQGQREAARGVLFSETYEEQKRIYAAGMQAVHASMDDRVETQIDSGQRHLSVAGWGGAAALVIMASAWFGILLVVTRHNGHDALALIQSETFDVVITDVMMPAMGGEELIRRLGKLAPGLLCIVLTGNAKMDEVRRIAKAPNVAGILVKPWDKNRLMDTLKSAMARQEAEPVRAL